MWETPRESGSVNRSAVNSLGSSKLVCESLEDFDLFKRTISYESIVCNSTISLISD